eukprot:NODE_103_length_20051_cov_0.229401.p5 type:complete len:536 gc:universal NODE_103_length_20051_cov_0.229401:10930-9323(-)
MKIENPCISKLSWKFESSQECVVIVDLHLKKKFEVIKHVLKPEELQFLKEDCIIFMEHKIQIAIDQSLPFIEGALCIDYTDLVYLLAYKVIVQLGLKSNLRMIFLGEIRYDYDIISYSPDQIDCRNSFVQTMENQASLIFYFSLLSEIEIFHKGNRCLVSINTKGISGLIIPPHSLVFVPPSANLIETLYGSFVDVKDFEVRSGLTLVEKSLSITSKDNLAYILTRGAHPQDSFIVNTSHEVEFYSYGKLLDRTLLETVKVHGYYVPVYKGKMCEYQINGDSNSSLLLQVEAKCFTEMMFKVKFLAAGRELIGEFTSSNAKNLFLPVNTAYVQLFVDEQMHSWMYLMREMALPTRNEVLIETLFKEIENVGLPLKVSLEELASNFKVDVQLAKNSKSAQQQKKGSIHEKLKGSRDDFADVYDPCGFKWIFTITSFEASKQAEKQLDFHKDITIECNHFKLAAIQTSKSLATLVEDSKIACIRDEMISRKLVKLPDNCNSKFRETLKVINSSLQTSPISSKSGLLLLWIWVEVRMT